MLNMYIALCWL